MMELLLLLVSVPTLAFGYAQYRIRWGNHRRLCRSQDRCALFLRAADLAETGVAVPEALHQAAAELGYKMRSDAAHFQVGIGLSPHDAAAVLRRTAEAFDGGN